MAETGSSPSAKVATVRLATQRDVPAIAALIRQLAKFERLSDACIATEADFSASLFKQPPFEGPTVFMLELRDPEIQAQDSQRILDSVATQQFEFITAIDDPDSSSFVSFFGPEYLVVGLALFFPNYSTFLAKAGIYLEDLFIREPYRRHGLGKFLLQTLAREAARRGSGRVEWSVLDWNVNAIKFYQEMGALVMPDWRICRLAGDALKAFA